jgi:cytochrome c oxidase assembly protein subunit 11
VRSRIANYALLRKLLVVVVVMFGFGFALVPFYKKICEVTGINNILQADKIENTQIDYSRKLSIEFDANTQSIPWQFKPLQRSISVHPGEVTQVLYEIENPTDRIIQGQAVPSYGPQLAGQYFKKLECFCFKQQTLKPHEKRQMPVVFVIDAKLPVDVNTITLSYVFFEISGTSK